MSDPLGKFLFGALSGYLFRRDRGAEKRAEQLEREERKAIEKEIRRLRAEKRQLLLQRVYQVLQVGLDREVRILIGKTATADIKLDSMAIGKLAEEVTKMIARELGRED